MHILIAGANRDVRGVARRRLEAAGCTVSSVENHATAETLVAGAIDGLVVLCSEDDEHSGLRLASLAHASNGHELRVAFVSGFAAIPLIVSAGDDGGLYDRLGAATHLGRIAELFTPRSADPSPRGFRSI